MNNDFFFIENLNPLYEAVQSNKIFHDSKFFADCIPKFSSDKILQNYKEAKQKSGFNLKDFVAENFEFPPEKTSDYKSAGKPIVQHIEELWDELQRTTKENAGTLIGLPHPYIVPGGRFREVYYWDSYFTMLGLQISKRIDVIQNMIDNFEYLINTIGFIPNGNRTYYIGRSQPPFFSLMIKILQEEKGEKILLKYRAALENEYAFWMAGEEHISQENPVSMHVVRLQDGSLLNRYWDKNDYPRPEAYNEDFTVAKASGKELNVACRHLRSAAASGWDFSSRWFKDGMHMKTIYAADIIPVDLNCLLVHLEETLQKIFSLAAEDALAVLFEEKIKRRKKAITLYCWNEEKGFYFDYDHVEKKQTGEYTLAAASPLFFRVAGQQQAQRVGDIIEREFLQPGGLLTTLRNTGQQWDAPNGWAPLQWMAYKGLQLYGQHLLAKKIKNNWTSTCEKVYNETGKMMEKYNVTDTATKAGGGEYPNQDGFGWTNGVYLKMINEPEE